MEDDNDTGRSRVRSKVPGQWYSNDIKVEIPEYDGKLDPGEFVEWLRTVKCAFDYKETSEEHKNQRPTEEYSWEFKYLLMKCDLLEDDPQTLALSNAPDQGGNL
uniref:Reverse transcriptase domain-containing protein n=1 Tax=Tanacetum cinerariifolium TaxID=118510 RepID=A0A699GQU4_TANCI|nr:hypothetical protein CTI12_AA486490 [Tanacetum cinerariifolium]